VFKGIVLLFSMLVLFGCGSGPGGSSGSEDPNGIDNSVGAGGEEEEIGLVEKQFGVWERGCASFDFFVPAGIVLGYVPEVQYSPGGYSTEVLYFFETYSTEVLTISEGYVSFSFDAFSDAECTLKDPVSEAVWNIVADSILGGETQGEEELESKNGWVFIEYNVPSELVGQLFNVHLHQAGDRLYKVEIPYDSLASGEELTPSDYIVNFNKYYERVQ